MHMADLNTHETAIVEFYWRFIGIIGIENKFAFKILLSQPLSPVFNVDYHQFQSCQ